MKNAPPQDITRLKVEYDHLRKLTKVAAEKACNAWWSDRAAEAEHRALVAEQQGRGGSLIRDLHLLGKKFIQACLIQPGCQGWQSLVERRAEHLQEMVNCQIDIDAIPIEDFPIVTPHSSSDTTLSGYDLPSPLSKEELIAAIF